MPPVQCPWPISSAIASRSAASDGLVAFTLKIQNAFTTPAAKQPAVAIAAPRVASQAPRSRIAAASPTMNGRKLIKANMMSTPVMAVRSRCAATVASRLRLTFLSSLSVSVPGGMVNAEAMMSNGASGALAASKRRRARPVLSSVIMARLLHEVELVPATVGADAAGVIDENPNAGQRGGKITELGDTNGI